MSSNRPRYRSFLQDSARWDDFVFRPGDAEEIVPNSDLSIWKQPCQFFHRGTGGYWSEFLDETAQRHYEARVSELVSPEVAAWAHLGWQSARKGTGNPTKGDNFPKG